MNHALLRPQPAHLAIRSDAQPEVAEVLGERFERAAQNMMFQGMNCGDTDFVTAAVGESQSITLQPARTIGLQDNVGSRVIRIDVYRVRTIEHCRGRKANVTNDDVGDSSWHGIGLIHWDHLSGFRSQRWFLHSASSRSESGLASL